MIITKSTVTGNTMKLIGEILAETCDLTQDVIAQALRLQSGNGLRLGEILIGQNLISEADLHSALSFQSRTNHYALEERSAILPAVPVWIKVCVFGTVAVAGVWILSSVLINIAKAFGQ
jgi:hypothetical protein